MVEGKNQLMYIIANFTPGPKTESMPGPELCHRFHARRLTVMQSTQYSVYNPVYKKELE